MKIRNSINSWLHNIFFEDGKIDLKNVSISELKAELYFMELAVEKVSSIIGGIISESRFNFFQEDKLVKKKDFYSFNIEPNKNENASRFWMKVADKMIHDNECLVVFLKDQYFVCDSFFRDDTKPMLENIYSNVVIESLSLNRTFKESEVLYFSLNSNDIKSYIDMVYSTYGLMLAAIKESVLENGDKHYFLNINSTATGSPKFQDRLKEMLGEKLKIFFKHGKKVMPVYDGFEYKSADKGTFVPSTDFRELRKDVFSLAAESYKIPVALMFGDTSTITNEVLNNLMTFAIKPIVGVIRKEMQRKLYGFDSYQQGWRVEIDISKAKYRDILEMATSIDKLLGSGTFCIDEIRDELGMMKLNTEFSRKHFMTKNYATIEELLTDLNVVKDVHKDDGTMGGGG